METIKTIPAHINNLSLLDAARFYRDSLGWVVHPLYGPDQGTDHERGKRPWSKGWKKLTPSDITDAYLQKHFGNGQRNNLGKVNHLPEITIDLDSKPDKGASVMAWDSASELFKTVPCERTAGGLHYHLICEDVPQAVIDSVGKNQKLEGKLNDAVSFEIFLGGNIALTPSTHKSGHKYSWLRTGRIPVTPWELIQKTFPFSLGNTSDTPARASRKTPHWWVRFKGDLSSLDIVGLAQKLSIYGKLLDADEHKHSIHCPWADQHTTDKSAWQSDDSGTAIFEARNKRFPGFKCLHTSHGEKCLEDLLKWAEEIAPGIVDQHCAQQRVWVDGQKAQDGRPRLILPAMGRPDSEFAADAGEILNGVQNSEGFFLRHGWPVEVSAVTLREQQSFLGFVSVKPARAITLIERFADVGKLVDDDAHNKQFVPCSMGKGTAEILLAAQQFRKGLPRVDRILDVPVPILKQDGGLAYPKLGYDPEFHTYLDPHAPQITSTPLADSLKLLRELFVEFCFRDAQSLVHAIAAFITPFCKGLFHRWSARTPIWLYKANRERIGKDYCANLSSILYEGRTNEYPPLDSDVPETRKKITSALISGRRRMHWANCRGYIANSAFEGLVTAEIWSDRVLGVNEDVTFPNEMELSLSANTGLTYTPDFANRCRIIMLHYEEEDANARRFQRLDLHDWLLKSRGQFISALASLINHWDRAGRPPGPTPFTSFPIWARVVGGIMVCAGIGDPCLPMPDSACEVDGDRQTADMKTVFTLAHEQFGAEWVKKDRILALIVGEEGEGLFSWMDLENRGGKTAFALLLNKFVGRVLGGIRLNRNSTPKQARQHTFQFVLQDGPTPGHPQQSIMDEVFKPEAGPADGNVSNVGNVCPTPNIIPVIQNYEEKEKNEEKELDDSKGKVANLANAANPRPALISTAGPLGAIAEQIAVSGQPVALDMETYGDRGGLNPWDGDIRLLTLSIPEAPPWILDLKAIGYDLGPLAGALVNAQIIGHNIKFDALWLRVKCGLILENLQDTLTAARILTAGLKAPNDLAAALRRRGIEIPKDQARSDWGAQFLTEDQLRYAADDVRHLHTLYTAQMNDLRTAGLLAVYCQEMKLLPHVVAMEANGFAVDRGRLQAILAKARQNQQDAAVKLREVFHQPTLNPASPAQLKAALNAVGVAVDSTSAEALQVSGDTLYVPLILACRSAEKVMEQARKLLGMIAGDGRIHARFEPTGTETGRFSSKEPNLQNIGRGELRSCFIAEPGNILVVADYSQIELRAAAAIANEPKMIEAYQRGEDLHRQTAALVLNKRIEDVTKDDRQLAKAVNFGLLYGQGANGLIRYAQTNYGVALSLEKAKQIRSLFFTAYHGLQVWHSASRRSAQDASEVRTVTGRRRLLPAGMEDDVIWQRFTALLNTPVQGGCADGLKAALIRLCLALPTGARLISTVHDEVIVEAPASSASEVRALVETSMKSAMAELFPTVPIEVEAKLCSTWGEK